MISLAILLFLLHISSKVDAQIIANSTNFQIQLFPQVSILQLTNSSSLYFPNDTIRVFRFTPSYIYALSTDNVIQIYSKENPSILQANITQYFLPKNSTQAFEYNQMTFDANFATLVLSGFHNSTLRHVVFTTANESLPTLSSSIDILTTYSQPPWTTFVANSIVYSFFSASGMNDSLHSLHLRDNSSFTLTLPTVNASLAVSPNRLIAIIWTQYSQVYFFDIANNFSLLSRYNESVINQEKKTQFVKFSSDGTFAILETDNHNPVRVINLTDFSVSFSFSLMRKIISIDFLDVESRFLFVNCEVFAYVYDTVTNTLLTFNASLNATSVWVDQNSSQLIADINGTFSVFGVNGTVNGSLVFGHYYSSTVSPSPSASSPFSYPLNLTAWQNQTFETMRSVSQVIEDVLRQFNTVVFSSPLTCFFLGFFNYFVLNSLYVLLPIPLPDLVFNELASVFNSTNTNLLASLGIKLTLPLFTEELVDEDRPLYFGVSSDLLSTDAYPLCLILLNVFIVEVAIALRHMFPKGTLANYLLCLQRERVYFGFTVSLMVQNILPWKYITFNKGLDFQTKTNSFCLHIIFILFVYFQSAFFIALFPKDTKNGSKKSKKDSQISQWIIGFQNFIYPLLVLFSSPMYFLVLVLISKIVEIIFHLRYERCSTFHRILQMSSFTSEIVYHLTFFIFHLSINQQVIVYSSIICLSAFLLGAILNFILVIAFIATFFTNLWKFARKSNKITQQNGQMRHKGKQKSSFNNKAKASPIKAQSPNQLFDQRKIPHYYNSMTIKRKDTQKKNVRFQYWGSKDKRSKKLKFQLRFEQNTIKLDSMNWNHKL